MPGCKTGDLAVLIYHPEFSEHERQYLGTFITCGKGYTKDGKAMWKIVKPSQPLLDPEGNSYYGVADCGLQPIRDTRIDDKVLEHDYSYE